MSALPPTSDPSLVSLRRLEDELRALARDRHASKHRMLHLLAAYDRRNGWVLAGATSCTAWWADVCGIQRSTAREQLRVARVLIELPALDHALAEEQISYAKARAISRLADPHTIDELIELSQTCSAGRLGVLLAAWQQERLSPSSVSAAQQAARSLSWRTEPDGMTTFTLRSPPVEAGTVAAAIDTQVLRSDTPAGASLGQARADALLTLLTSGGSVSAEVLIHVARPAVCRRPSPTGLPFPIPNSVPFSARAPFGPWSTTALGDRSTHPRPGPHPPPVSFVSSTRGTTTAATPAARLAGSSTPIISCIANTVDRPPSPT